MKSKKFVKKVKKSIPWISHIITDEKSASELSNISIEPQKLFRSDICLICRGTKLLCGRKRCPIIEKWYSFRKIESKINSRVIIGSSPPGVFVGRFGYPYVWIGPLVPPFSGDTRILDTPELWHSKKLNEIIDFRLSLVRGKTLTHIRKFGEKKKLVEIIQELSISKISVDSDLILKRRPSGILFDSETQPIGPSAPLLKIDVSNIHADHRIEKISFDDDLKAVDSLYYLYRNGVFISGIIRAFSMGLLGMKNERKLVPTRWCITAVDSTLSRFLRDNFVKNYPIISEYMLFETENFDDKFIVILIPDAWSFEFIEAWYPGTAWNIFSDSIAIAGDFEPYWGRASYASIGGCYYATRLAVSEYLTKIRKQARVLVLRETYPGHILPLGVWHVRESVRCALKHKPKKFSSFKAVLEYISNSLKISVNTWVKVSRILRDLRTQEKLTTFFYKPNM